MLLAIDIGNTHTVVGIFKGDRLKKHFRVFSRHTLTTDECIILFSQLLLQGQIRKGDIRGAIICSVVPNLTAIFRDATRSYLGIEAIIVDWNLDLNIKIRYDLPQQVGADRIANAVAAYHLYKGPTIVVDLGTATTFDAISKDGEYLGGAIAPGIETSSADLFRRAAQLYKVSLEAPRAAIGTNTTESLKSGIIFGAVGQIDEITRRMKKELKGKVFVVATGGLTSLVANHSKTIKKINPVLTLQGLKIIYHRIAGNIKNKKYRLK